MPDLERVQQNTPLTISHPWTEDGVAVDPGTVTIGITRADGTVLVAAGTATSGSGTSARTFNLTTTHTALLDRLTVTWTSTLKGTLVSYVEVGGGFLFGISEAFAVKPTGATWTTAQIITARLRAEQTLERHLGVAFVPRYRFETITSTDRSSILLLAMPKVRAIRSISVDGTALTAGELTDLTIGPYGITGRYWTGHLVVGYEHGWDGPEEPIRDAALSMAYYYLTAGVGQEGVDPRVEYVTTPEGRINYGTSGLGLPAVQAAISTYDLSVGVA